jgi:hypothetical protein
LAAVLALAIWLVARPSPQPARVSASDYDAFWLWAGVKPQPVLQEARQIYLLAGEVRHQPPVRLVAQRAAAPHITYAEVWMVVRVETLRWPPQVHEQLDGMLSRWRSAGNRLVGLQVDFDARTRHLQDYAAFLADLRRRLPADMKLGTTGLLDWSANAYPAGLDALAGTVDEVVLQIYQGRQVIPGYEAYLARLDRLNMPFRIGLLQDGEWKEPRNLRRNPNFRGYVVFLHN